jgi:hypothetical protein
VAENVPQTIEVPVPLELFGSLVTEMNASDLPEGISPDNQDVVYLPGGVGSRPCMRKWLSGLPGGTTITYEKTFVTPAGISLNLILTSDGKFWVQNTQVPPYLPIEIGNVVAGSYASSVSAFGRELIVFHNNVTGTDIPRTYDGQYFDRATQGGPGAAPVVTNTILPPSSMAVSGTNSYAISSAVSIAPYVVGGTTYYAQIQLTLTVPGAPLSVGQIVGYLSGTYNTGGPIVSVIYNNVGVLIGFTTYYFGTSTGPDTGGTVTVDGTSLQRGNNTVTATTATPHGLSMGYQAQISGVDNSTVGNNIESIVIDNETTPGVALITTQNPHGLVPQNLVNLIGIPSVAVGGGISAAARSAEIVTITTTLAHGLSIGALVTVAGLSDNTYNGQFTVLSVPSLTTFTYSQVDTDSISGGSGTVNLEWIPNTVGLLTNYYTVSSCPTSTTFYVQVSYSDGTWGSGGLITFPWNGIFYVTAILSATQFQYQQYGPSASTTEIGLVTPFSQISPGVHQCCVLFQTRQGFIPAPSPTTQFVANGGQYLTISNIPLGPPNIIARYLAFSGAGGDNFFYIPVPAFVGGIFVSTSTAIYDNVTSSILVDFSDNTLFDSLAIDIPGNNLFEMAVLGPCLGVDSYASRAEWWGWNNSIPNLLNLGFEGGYISGDLTTPLGWTVNTPGGILDTSSADFGMSWLITSAGGGADGQISQPVYRDTDGIAILQPLTQYTVNYRLSVVSGASPFNGIAAIDFYSPTVGILASANLRLPDTNSTSFYTNPFTIATPAIIPMDAILRIYLKDCLIGTRVAFDEIQIYPTLVPTVPNFLFSYVNFPESLDQVTGVLGGADDPTPIQATFKWRDAFLFLTQAKLHETTDLAGYEPSDWKVREVSNNCGACGPNACSTGENFSVWVSSPSSTPPVGRGLYIHTGGNVYKISQEIQPDFDSINLAAQSSIWVCNDSVTRRIYVGTPISGATAPNRIYVLDYRELNTAADVAEKPPIHISFSGKMICSDLSRKWTKWNVSANCGGIIYVPGVGSQFCVGGGNGQAPGLAPGFANAYWFDSTLLTDEDYGQVVPYYTTYFFINHQAEQSMQVGLHRKLYKRYAAYITGVGQFQLTPFANSLSNPWPAAPLWPLNLTQGSDIGDGLNVNTERCAFQIASVPYIGQTDNSFNVGKLIITLSQEPISPIRYGAV